MDPIVPITDRDHARVLGSLSPSCPCKALGLANDCEMTAAQVVAIIREAKSSGWPIIGTALTGYLLKLGDDTNHRAYREWLDAWWDQIGE